MASNTNCTLSVLVAHSKLCAEFLGVLAFVQVLRLSLGVLLAASQYFQRVYLGKQMNVPAGLWWLQMLSNSSRHVVNVLILPSTRPQVLKVKQMISVTLSKQSIYFSCSDLLTAHIKRLEVQVLVGEVHL